MWWKAFLVWLLFMVGAIINGTLREKAITPYTGEAVGHIISTVLLCLIILGISWLMVPWVGPETRRAAFAIGGAWLLLTMAFEFGVGYFISHRSWPEMLADYALHKGRIWVFVPVVTFLAPWSIAQLRGSLP